MTTRPPPNTTGPWPSGCYSPNSCVRNGACMYKGCRHEDQLTETAIAAAYVASQKPKSPSPMSYDAPEQPTLTIEDGRVRFYDSKALTDIVAERIRQIQKVGGTPERDDHYGQHELSRAAACYARAASLAPGIRKELEAAPQSFGLKDRIVSRMWPWDVKWWKPTDRRRDLVKAGALIIAEIERLDRLAARKAQTSDADPRS